MFLERKLITPPAVEPIDADALKDHLRFDLSAEDVLIDGYIAAAREHLETITDRKFISQTWDVFAPCFPAGDIVLPFGGVSSVSAFEWTDAAGDVSSWTVSGSNLLSGASVRAHIDLVSEPGKIRLAYAQNWPTDTLATLNPIRIRMVSGWPDAASVPKPLRQAITLLAAHWFENRLPVALGNPSAIDSKDVRFALAALIPPWRMHA